MLKSFVAAFVVLLTTSIVVADDKQPLPEKVDATGFRDVLVKTGDVYISGQPSIEGLERMAKDGVKTVVSFRTPSEMNNRDVVPFDEAAKAAELGINYVNIPLGGDHAYSPDALAEFAKVMEAADGKTLIHCTVGWRASHAWAAYLVKYKGMDINEAAEHGRAANMGVPPMESLLGGNVSYSLPAGESESERD